MTVEEQDRLCYTSQTLLRALSVHPKYVLGIASGPDIFAGPCQLNDVLFVPSEPLLWQNESNGHEINDPQQQAPLVEMQSWRSTSSWSRRRKKNFRAFCYWSEDAHALLIYRPAPTIVCVCVSICYSPTTIDVTCCFAIKLHHLHRCLVFLDSIDESPDDTSLGETNGSKLCLLSSRSSWVPMRMFLQVHFVFKRSTGNSKAWKASKTEIIWSNGTCLYLTDCEKSSSIFTGACVERSKPSCTSSINHSKSTMLENSSWYVSIPRWSTVQALILILGFLERSDSCQYIENVHQSWRMAIPRSNRARCAHRAIEYEYPFFGVFRSSIQQ